MIDMIVLYALHPTYEKMTLPNMSSLDDITQQLPQGLYTTFRTYENKTRVIGLMAHLNRLYNPAGTLISIDQVRLRSQIREVLAGYSENEVRIRIHVATIGQPGDVYLYMEPLKIPDESVYAVGVHVNLAKIHRNTPKLKTTSFIKNSQEQRLMLNEKGYYETLMVKNGQILEGMTSNFYGVKHGKIFTARQGILLGITRRCILQLARKERILLQYDPIRIDELEFLDEAFITSSGRGVVPVSSIENRQVGDGKVGNIAKLLRNRYDSYVIKKSELI